ncbi:Kinesin-1 heavy chain like [Actinidia chinensis var. chinensis]|uniref:Kinesin-1 heavy chain like n=1 Tax=Actinidia chinensis var. chinensis TaxID=1590841 RepID=A0A2R6RG40_ACTCC|nr:Kinesin-1 heavy chain like [Actinidia chinensis var. chinensis]
MHMRSRCLPRPSASNPLDNRARPMANTSQAPNLEGLHHEIHGMAEQMRVMNENNAHLIKLLAVANPPPPAASPVPEIERSHRSHHSGDDHSQNNHTFSATLKGIARSWFRKLAPRTIDSFGNLSRLFVANFMGCRVRQKNASHLFTIHQKEAESLKDYVKWFNQVVLEVEDPSDKVVIMAMMEGLRPGPLFDSLSKNIQETLSSLQSKAAAEELAEAK